MAPLSTILATAGAANLAARGFSYHDNGVRFISYGGVSSGVFSVTELSISSGQDPQGKNRVGDVHTMTMLNAPDDYVNQDGGPAPAFPGFVFTVGRHKTDQVADFWKQRIPATKTAFDHDPGSLNFAFIGDMDLDLPACGGKVHMPTIGLAQGSDSNGSNWWFGGTNCDYIGSDQVSCTGTRQDGKRLAVKFQRGGKGLINDIYINQCLLVL